MKEIKFRAWNNETKTMLILDPLEWQLCALKEEDNWKVMQYTGLKDESGVEIYEGDVFGLFGGDVERPNEYEFHAKVYFDNDFSAFCVELYNGGWEYLSDYLDNPKNEREVIGNIYENPELVK